MAEETFSVLSHSLYGSQEPYKYGRDMHLITGELMNSQTLYILRSDSVRLKGATSTV